MASPRLLASQRGVQVFVTIQKPAKAQHISRLEHGHNRDSLWRTRAYVYTPSWTSVCIIWAGPVPTDTLFALGGVTPSHITYSRSHRFRRVSQHLIV
jgi:hypothetical protein